MAIAVKIVTANFTKCVKSLQCKLKVFFLKKLLVFSESFYFTFQEETAYLIDKKKAFKLSQMSLIAMQVKLF